MAAENELSPKEKREATILALEMYENFASELITALTNIKGIKEALYVRADIDLQPKEKTYYQGQKDAFEEVVNRVAKEYRLARQKADYYKYDEDVFREIGHVKNHAVDKLITENSIRGKYKYPKVHLFKGKLADLLEGFSNQGFILGEKYRDAKSVEEKRKLINDFIDATNKATGTIEPIDANDIL